MPIAQPELDAKGHQRKQRAAQQGVIKQTPRQAAGKAERLKRGMLQHGTQAHDITIVDESVDRFSRREEIELLRGCCKKS